MTTVIAKNADVVDVEIEDLGTTIPVSGQETLTDNYAFVGICRSKDLKQLVQNGNIVINDGFSDLSMSDGLNHIDVYSIHETPTGGGGDPTQAFDAYDNVGGMTITTTPQDVVLTTERKKTAGFSFSGPSAELTFSVTDTMVVFGKVGERPVSTAGATRGNANVKFQLDTGAGYSDVPGVSLDYNREGAFGGTPVMFAVIDVSPGDKIKMQTWLTNGTPDIETVAQGSSLTVFSLKGPKGDQGDPGTAGGWEVGATPPASPSDGDGWYNTGDKTLYIYDGSRTKWLSTPFVSRLNRYLGADNGYLRAGEVRDDRSAGVTFHRNATLIGISIIASHGNANKNCDIEVDGVSVFNFNVVSYDYDNDSLNIDLDIDELLQVFVSSTGTSLKNPVCYLEFAWRYTP